jgi:hypothetical protein
MISRVAQAWWGFLIALLLLASWLCCSGNVWLYGLPQEILEGLAAGRGLLEPALSAPLHLRWLAALPGDSLAWVSRATVMLNFCAGLALLAAGRFAWRNPISCGLALGVAFFSAGSQWTVSLTPLMSLTHLALALSLAALVRGAVPLLAGCVLLLGALSPAHGVMMFLALAQLAYRRQEVYGLLVPTLSVFGVGCLLIPMAGDFRLQPSLQGWHLLTLLPLALSLWPGQIRAARGGLYASLLLGSGLTGTPELATVLAVGDAVFVALQALGKPAAAPNSSRGWRLSGPALLGLGATLLLIWVVLPGERHLNRRILIPAQKAGVPLGRLLTSFSLEEHARLVAQQQWRQRVPFPRLNPADFELALELAQQPPLSEGLCPLTLDGQAESRQVALLYALLSGQRLGGWDDPQHLAAPLLLCKLRERSFLSRGPAVILRRPGEARLSPVLSPPEELAPLDFRSTLMVAYRIQQVSRQPGTAYRWVSGSGQYELVFSEQPAELVFSGRPGKYQVLSLANAEVERTFKVPAISCELSGLPQEETLPSRSLVPVTLRLANTGHGPIASELFQSWRLETTSGNSFSPFSQRGASDFILYPGESLELNLQLATPEPEGVYQVRALAITPEGKELEIPFGSDGASIRTWRRLPPVGTWVEEP